MQLPSLEDVKQAAERIAPYIHHTPVLTSQSLNELTGVQLFFKCENFQRMGAFKTRGAFNALLNLDDEARDKGIVTHSSGNHASALAYAAHRLGIRSHIVMPRDVSAYKENVVREFADEVTVCEPGMPARERTTRRIMQETGATLIHPYDDFQIISGQATATLEFHESINELDTLLVPVGGGGLISGALTVLKHLAPQTIVYGVEPEVVAEAQESLKTGKRQSATGNPTQADGLQAGVGELNFEILQTHCDGIFTVTEDQITRAMKLIWERLKIVVEPSAAVTLAAVMHQRVAAAGGKVGLILSGGNRQFDA